MTKEEAKKAIEVLKSGKIFIDSQYNEGYLELSYNLEEDSFLLMTSDSTIDVYEPEIEEKTLTQDEVKAWFMRKIETFADFFACLS